MLPEAREATEKYMMDYEMDMGFPLTEFTACLGFFLVMVLEHIVMVCRHNHKHKEHKEAKSRDQSSIIQNADPIAVVEQVEIGACSQRTNSLQVEEERVRTRSFSRSASLALEGSFAISQPRDTHAHHDHHRVDDSDLASVRSFVLLLAISIHTVFEGLAIGLQPTSMGVWNLFLAIIIHKLIIAFSLGLQFAEHLKRKSRAVMFIVIFSVLSPIGIAIATTITAYGQSDESMAFDVVTGVLQCISTGTLLYVTFFEVLMAEIGNDHCLLKVFFVVIGFTLMTFINLFLREPED